jgi:hypothetical protein
MVIGQYTDGVEPERTPVKQVYHDLISEGMDAKSAAKEAQARTGLSLVTGREISKKLDFTSKGKAVYSGQYPDATVGKSKSWKPAAWPN